MNYLALFQAIVFLIFITSVNLSYGLLGSISASFYELKKTNMDWAFSLFGAFVGIPLWFYGNYTSNDAAITLYALSGFFMFGLTIASWFRDDEVIKILHYTFTLLAIILALGGIHLQYGHGLIWLLPMGVIVLFLSTLKNSLLWIEYFMFAVIIGRLLIL